MSFQKIDHQDEQRPEGNTCILIYGYDAQGQEILKKYANAQGIEALIVIENDMTHNTLDTLIHGQATKADASDNLGSPAIILHAVSQAELNSIVHNYKQLGLPRCLFAMVTPTSIHWKFHDLMSDLLEERAMIAKMRAEQAKKV